MVFFIVFLDEPFRNTAAAGPAIPNMLNFADH